MAKIRTYHGVVIVDKQPGFRDSYMAQWRHLSVGVCTKCFGHGALLDVFEHFEVKLGLGRIGLEHTPIGIRVYTEVDDAEATDAGYDKLPGAAADRRTSESRSTRRFNTQVLELLTERFPWLVLRGAEPPFTDGGDEVNGADVIDNLREWYISLH